MYVLDDRNGGVSKRREEGRCLCSMAGMVLSAKGGRNGDVNAR